MKKLIFSFLGALAIACFPIGGALADSSLAVSEIAKNLHDPALRENAIKQLLSMGDSVLPELKVMIDSSDKNGQSNKYRALLVLGQMKSSGAFQLAEKVLDDTDPRLRATALDALCRLYANKIGEKDHMLALAKKCLMDEADEPRCRATGAICQVVQAEAVIPLLDTIGRELAKPIDKRGDASNSDFYGSDSTIMACQFNLEAQGMHHTDFIAATALNYVKQHNVPDLRYIVAYLTYRLGVKPIDIDTLLEGLTESSLPSLQVSIARSFGEIGDPDKRIIAALTPLLKSNFRTSLPCEDNWIYPLRLAAKSSLAKLNAYHNEKQE